MARGVVNGEVKVRDARNRAASVDGRLCVAVVLDVNEQAGRTEAEPGEELAVDGGNQELGRTLPSLRKKEGRRGNRKTLFVEGERAPCGRRIKKGKFKDQKEEIRRARAGWARPKKRKFSSEVIYNNNSPGQRNSSNPTGCQNSPMWFSTPKRPSLARRSNTARDRATTRGEQFIFPPGDYCVCVRADCMCPSRAAKSESCMIHARRAGYGRNLRNRPKFGRECPIVGPGRHPVHRQTAKSRYLSWPPPPLLLLLPPPPPK